MWSFKLAAVLLLYHGLLLWFLSLWTFLFSTQRRGKGGNSDMEPIDKWLITQGMVRTSPVKRFLLPTPVPSPRITILHSPLVLPYWTAWNQTVQGVYSPPTSFPGAKGKICTNSWFIQHKGPYPTESYVESHAAFRRSLGIRSVPYTVLIYLCSIHFSRDKHKSPGSCP